MTRNNDTSYRHQGRAVVLAAIMVLSVVGASVAFTGSAAAVAPDKVDLETDDMPGVVYPGQEFDVNVANADDADFGDEAYFVRISRDDGDIDGFSLISTLENSSNGFYNIDTTDAESGN